VGFTGTKTAYCSRIITPILSGGIGPRFPGVAAPPRRVATE
jgi:hypothetical protein